MDEAKRQLRRLILSADDLAQARRIAEYILEMGLYREKTDQDAIVGRGLQMAAIVSYARPFSGNYSFEHTVGQLAEIHLNDLTEPPRAIHERMLRLRNRALAHTDADVRDLDVRIIDWMGKPTSLPTSHNPFASLPADEWQRFLTVVGKIESSVSDAIIETQRDMTPGDQF